MFLSAMTRDAAKEGLTIKQILERRRKETGKLPPRKQGKPKSRKRVPFERPLKRELYMRRAMD